jgi:CRISPR/Cas system CMR-associated protein Cmr5 small subunit
MELSTHDEVQNAVNDAYRRCEKLKDEIALLRAMYESTATCLSTMVKKTGIHPTIGYNL